MKKLLLLLLIGMFMISSVSAWDWDNVVAETGTDPNTGYPTMEVSNCDFWVGIPTLFGTCLNKGETLFEGSVTEHTKQCGEDCSSKMEFNHNGGVLIDDIRFLTEQDDGSWIKQPVRSYKLKYEAELPQYETQCVDLPEVYVEGNTTNGTSGYYYTPQECSQVQIGTYTGFKTYNVGDTLPSGYYEMFLEAEKKPSRTVDWQIKVEGRWMEEWAVWGLIDTVYQEDANSTQYVGSWSTTLYIDDGNWGTNSGCNSGTCYFYANYTKIDDFRTFATGSYKASGSQEGNVTIPNSCYDYYSTKVTIRMWTTASGRVFNYDCFNGTWSNLYSGGTTSESFYEEGLYWNATGDAQVTLNSPTDNYISDTDSVTFNATAEVTNGAYLTNMSLWTNATGTWALNESITGLGGVSPFNFTDGSLVAYYPLNETTGTVRDVSMTGATGKVGNAFNFDGVKDYVDSEDIPLGSTDRTISAWFKTSSLSQQTIIDKNQEFTLFVINGGIQLGSFGDNSGTLGSGYADGQWHHVLAVFDSSTKYVIYVDGSDISGGGVSTTDTSADSANTAYIGAQNGNSFYFNGSLDELSVFNTALTGTEATSFYNSENGKSYSSLTAGEKTNLVSYYSLDEVGSDPLDSHGSNDGTLSGGTITLGAGSRGATGIIEQAIDFDGSATKVTVSHNTALNLQTDMSYSFWYYKDSSTPFQILLEKSSGSDRIRFQIDAGGTAIQFTDATNSVTSGTLTNGAWHYLTFVKTGTSAQWYLNGTTSGSSGTVKATVSNTADMYLGSLGSSNYLDGKLDEFGIFNKALNTTEISDLYNSGAGLGYSTTSGSTSSTQTWTKTITDKTMWTVEACDTDGDCGFATSNYTVSLDATEPAITIHAPSGTVTNNGTILLNTTITDTNLEDCWYDYNGTNTTFTCGTGTEVWFNTSNENSITVYANDSVSNLASSTATFDWEITLNMKHSSGSLVDQEKWTINGTNYYQNPLTKDSKTFLDELENNTLSLIAEDLDGYSKTLTTSLNFRINQSTYNITLNPKSLDLDFFYYNGTTYNSSGFWVDSTPETGTFNDYNLTIPLLNLNLGKFKVGFGHNLSSIYNYSQFYEGTNDYFTEQENNLTIIDNTDFTIYFKTIDESKNPIDDVLVKFYVLKPDLDNTYHLIGQRYSGDSGSGLGKTFFYSDIESISYITYSKEGYQLGSKIVDLGAETHSITNPIPLELTRGSYELYKGRLLATCGWYNSNTTSLPLSLATNDDGGTNFEFNTSYSSTLTSIPYDSSSKLYLTTLTNGEEFSNSDINGVTIYLYEEGALLYNITAKYIGIETGKFNEPSGLPDKYVRQFLWIGLIFFVGLVGLLIKLPDEDIGGGGVGKMLFFISAFFLAVLSQGRFNMLLTVTAIYFLGLGLKKLIRE